MTVSITTSVVTYTGDAVTTDYGVPFRVLSASDLYVFVDEVLQIAGVDYNTVGLVTEPNSTVAFVVAPADQTDILIQRLTGLVQSTQYATYGEYKAAQHEADYDKAMLIAQENRDAAAGNTQVIANGIFQTSVTLLNTLPQFDPFVLSYESNIFAGAGVLLSIPDNGTVDTISFSLYGVGNVQHTMVFGGNGILTIPDQLWMKHPVTEAFGRVVRTYADTFSGGPWMREFIDDHDDLTGMGFARSWDWVDLANVTHAMVLDPVTGNVTVDKDPLVGETNALATVQFVLDQIAAIP